MFHFDACANEGASGFDLEPDAVTDSSFGGRRHSAAQLPASSDDNSAMVLSEISPGDFYACKEDPKRGFSLASNELFDNFQNHFQKEDDVMRGFSLAPGTYPHNSQSYSDHEGNKIKEVPTSVRFEEFETPPNVPADPFFELAKNHFIFRRSPVHCMNDLLEFLENEISEVTKVSRAKFKVKANLFDKTGMLCSIKCRFYRLQRGEHAVEFTKLSGDTVAFQKFYQQAYWKLASGSAGTESFADVPACPPWELPKVASETTELSPLIDMLSYSADSDIQAEAAAFLANIASDNPASAVVMCSAQLFEQLTSLLLIDRIDVAYPIASLLSSLVDCTSAKTLIADYGVVSAMKEQMLSVHKTTLVKQQLATAVNSWYQKDV